MLGTLVNTVTVIVGSAIGLLIHKGISQRLADQMMKSSSFMFDCDWCSRGFKR